MTLLYRFIELVKIDFKSLLPGSNFIFSSEAALRLFLYLGLFIFTFMLFSRSAGNGINEMLPEKKMERKKLQDNSPLTNPRSI